MIIPDSDEAIVRHSFYAAITGKVECLEEKVDCNLNSLNKKLEHCDTELRLLEENDIESQTTLKVARISLLGIWLLFSGIISWAWNDGVNKINEYADKVAVMERHIIDLQRETKLIKSLDINIKELSKKTDTILYKNGGSLL